MATSKLSLKLLIDTKGQRVLFAEASKDFVDFLFSLLTLPIGTVLSLEGNKYMGGALPMVYQSVTDLEDEYVKSDQNKDVLLKPTPALPFVPPQVPLLAIEQWSSSSKPSATPTTLYKCGSGSCNSTMLSNTYGSKCASNNYNGSYGYRMNCGQEMTTVVKDYVLKDALLGGFVKGCVKYMVADDLSVSPSSTIFNIALLNKFHIKDLGALEEKVVQIGMDEGLELLKRSLCSKKVLTDVFLGIRDDAPKEL